MTLRVFLFFALTLSLTNTVIAQAPTFIEIQESEGILGQGLHKFQHGYASSGLDVCMKGKVVLNSNSGLSGGGLFPVINDRYELRNWLNPIPGIRLPQIESILDKMLLEDKSVSFISWKVGYGGEIGLESNDDLERINNPSLSCGDFYIGRFALGTALFEIITFSFSDDDSYHEFYKNFQFLNLNDPELQNFVNKVNAKLSFQILQNGTWPERTRQILKTSKCSVNKLTECGKIHDRVRARFSRDFKMPKDQKNLGSFAKIYYIPNTYRVPDFRK